MTITIPSLLSDSGWDLLAHTQAEVDASRLPLAEVGPLLRSRGTPAELASLIATQITLRSEAQTKFGSAASTMVFTRQGLEQSTRAVVADLHAGRIKNAGIQGIADLGCGIGGDAISFARQGIRVLAVDNDLSTAQCAAANLREFPAATVVLADLQDFSPQGLRDQGFQAVYLDPARRRGGVRINNPAEWSPPLPEALAWHSPGMEVGVKVAPGIKHTDLPANFLAQWVSIGNELVECSLWSPGLSPEGAGRSAAIWDNDQWTVLSDPAVTSASQDSPWMSPGALGDYIFEPNPAVIRAGLIGVLSDQLGLHPVSEGIAYLTGDSLSEINRATFRSYRVLEVSKLRPKNISAALRQLGATSVEIKKRGVDIEPSVLRRQLTLANSGPKREITVILTRLEGRHCAILAERIPA